MPLVRVPLPRLPPRDDGPDAAARVAERGALRARWEGALAAGDPAVGGLARALDAIYVRTGPEAEHLRVLTGSLGSPALAEGDRGPLLHALGRLHALRGRHRAAVEAHAAARAAAPPGPEGARFSAACAVTLAYSLRALGRLDEARAEAAYAAASPDLDRRAGGELASGMVALSERGWVDAAAAFARGGAYARLLDAPRLEGIAEANLALTALGAGDLPAAGAAVARSHAHFTAAADRFHLVRLRCIEGQWRLRVGELDRAEALLAFAAAEAAADADADFELAALEGLVEVALARGDGARAEARLDAVATRAAVVDDASWPDRVRGLRARVDALLGGTIVLRLDADGRAVTLDGRPLDFGRRGPLRRVLLALVAARGRSLSVAELLDAGWPGERMTSDSGAARVYMAVRRLRALGLARALVTRDDGYRLASTCRVEPM